MVLMSVPAASKWLAKLCLSVCGPTCLWILACCTARLNALRSVLGDACHRAICWLLSQGRTTVEGKTNCQASDLEAEGYFLYSALGIGAKPFPRRISDVCNCATLVRWLRSAGIRASGSSVARSLLPLAARTVIDRRSKSISLTRWVIHSWILIPVP